MLNQPRWKLLLTTLLLATVLASAWGQQSLVASAHEDNATFTVEAAAAQTDPNAEDTTVGRSVRAADVLGYEVRNLEGDKIGEVEDIVVNTGDDQVLFATMNYSGGLFSSDKVYPVPISAFSWDADREELQLDLDEEALEDAPGFDQGWPDPTDLEFDKEVYDYWLGVFPDLPKPAETAEARKPGAIAKVSNMIGLEIINPAEEDLGTVEDLIVNIENQLLSTVVVSFQDYTGVGKAQYVIPVIGFEMDLTKIDNDHPHGVPTLAMSPNNMRNGPTFSSYVDLREPNWSEPYQRWWQRLQSYTENEVTPLSLAGTAWEAEAFGEPEDDLPVLPGTRLTLNFFGPRYAGSGGCDWLLGVYTADTDHLLRVETPAQSRLGCDVNIATQQGTYITSLLNITEYDIQDGKLIGYTVKDQRLVTFIPAEPTPFEETTWDLKFFQGESRWQPGLLGVEITAIFEGDQLSGSAGCNSYSATVNQVGDKLTLSNLTSTKKTCTEPEGIMTQEEVYLELLESTASMVQLDGMLELSDAQGQATLLFGVKDVAEQ